LVGIAGTIIIVFRKIPVLMKLPLERPENGLPKISLRERVINLTKEIARPDFWLIFISWLEKLLRKIRILVLRMDNYFIDLIKKSREKSHDWTEHSREWMSQKRMKRIEKLKLMATTRITPEQKEESLLSTLKQNPRDVKAYKELGLIYLEQNNLHDAKLAFEEVLKINPEDETAKEKLEQIKVLENGKAGE